MSYIFQLRIDQIRLSCNDEDNAKQKKQANQLAAVQSPRERTSNGIIGVKRIHE